MIELSDCINGNVTEVTEVVPYLIKVSAVGTREIIFPVDVYVSSVNIPMTQNDVHFDYGTSVISSSNCIGQYRFTKFYPVSHHLEIEGHDCTIISYGTPIKMSYSGMWYIECHVRYADTLSEERVTNVEVEQRVLTDLTQIALAGNDISELLSNYDFDMSSLLEDSKETSGKNAISAINGNGLRIINILSEKVKDDLNNNESASTLKADVTNLLRYTGAKTIDVYGNNNEYRLNSAFYVNDVISGTYQFNAGKGNKHSTVYGTGGGANVNDGILVIDIPGVDKYIVVFYENWETSNTFVKNTRAEYAFPSKNFEAGEIIQAYAYNQFGKNDIDNLKDIFEIVDDWSNDNISELNDTINQYIDTRFVFAPTSSTLEVTIGLTDAGTQYITDGTKTVNFRK